MAMTDGEPLEVGAEPTAPGQPGEPSRGRSEPGDDYFSSGSFSPVTVRFGDDADAEPERGGPEETPPQAGPDGEDSPRVLVQFGEDPGVVSSEEPE
jgi:hypothetical protein